MDTIGSAVTKNRKSINMLLIVLNPLNAIMDFALIRLFLRLVLVWACCTSKDMNLFFLVVVYFVVSGK